MREMETTTSVTSKGQVTIPKALRQRLGIRQGSRIAFVMDGDRVELRVAYTPPDAPASGFGLLKSSRKTVPAEFDPAVELAISNSAAGLDFADALHHASSRDCTRMASFDDRRFVRRAKRLGLTPPVRLA